MRVPSVGDRVCCVVPMLTIHFYRSDLKGVDFFVAKSANDMHRSQCGGTIADLRENVRNGGIVLAATKLMAWSEIKWLAVHTNLTFSHINLVCFLFRFV